MVITLGSSELCVMGRIGSTMQRRENTPFRFDRTVRLAPGAVSSRDAE